METEKDFSTAWLDLGTAQFQVRDYAEAVNSFDNALKYEKRRTAKGNIYYQLGDALAKLNKDQEAIEAYNNALTNTTQSYVKGAANFGLGEIYKNSGDKSKAIAYYQAASKDRTWKQSALYELDLLKKE